jgi:hypothetical protein
MKPLDRYQGQRDNDGDDSGSRDRGREERRARKTPQEALDDERTRCEQADEERSGVVPLRAEDEEHPEQDGVRVAESTPGSKSGVAEQRPDPRRQHR